MSREDAIDTRKEIKRRKLKIVSDGTSPGTYLIDVESGEQIDDVTAISWTIRGGLTSTAVMTISRMPIEATAREQREHVEGRIRALAHDTDNLTAEERRLELDRIESKLATPINLTINLTSVEEATKNGEL